VVEWTTQRARVVLVFRGRTDMLEALGTVIVAIAFLALLVVVGSAF
jgi:hypothetical protein